MHLSNHQIVEWWNSGVKWWRNWRCRIVGSSIVKLSSCRLIEWRIGAVVQSLKSSIHRMVVQRTWSCGVIVESLNCRMVNMVELSNSRIVE